ncbi:hypothetical protein EVAR_23498_1 [Eumeta japonica]|uniref:Uncharacterized protein n=1 Tax=Eumeta variegata TaxID=151549 RepID=A0A4C1W4J3_EUMVA|nr:hypothetical protein EVAR_23498_1 [Eumeta japonica]
MIDLPRRFEAFIRALRRHRRRWSRRREMWCETAKKLFADCELAAFAPHRFGMFLLKWNGILKRTFQYASKSSNRLIKRERNEI